MLRCNYVNHYPSTPCPFNTSASPESSSAISSSVTDASGMILSIRSCSLCRSNSFGATVDSAGACSTPSSGKTFVALYGVTNDNYLLLKLHSTKHCCNNFQQPQNPENKFSSSCDQLSVCIFMSHIYGWLIVNSDHYITLKQTRFLCRASLDHLKKSRTESKNISCPEDKSCGNVKNVKTQEKVAHLNCCLFCVLLFLDKWLALRNENSQHAVATTTRKSSVNKILTRENANLNFVELSRLTFYHI